MTDEGSVAVSVPSIAEICALSIFVATRILYVLFSTCGADYNVTPLRFYFSSLATFTAPCLATLLVFFVAARTHRYVVVYGTAKTKTPSDVNFSDWVLEVQFFFSVAM